MRMEETPALFLASGKRVSGVHERPYEGWLYNHPFFGIIYKITSIGSMSEYKKTALVLGAGGFIGSHMVKRLRSEGYWVRGVDLKHPEFSSTQAHEFITGDLRDVTFVRR